MEDKVLSDGYIKLYRKLLDNPLFKDAEALQLFIYGLLKASHKPQRFIMNGQEMRIDRGQFITGRSTIARDTGISPKKIRARIALLKNLGIWARQRASHFSIITVCNYCHYQGCLNAEGPGKGPSEGQARATYKNDKNEKKNYIECNDFETLSAFLSSLPEYVAFTLETREVVLEFLNRVRAANKTKRITGGRASTLLACFAAIKDKADEENLLVGLKKCFAKAERDGFDFSKRDPVAYIRAVAVSHKAGAEQKRSETQTGQEREALRKAEGGKMFQELRGLVR